MVIGQAFLGGNAHIHVEQAHVLIIDAEPVDHGVISTAKLACPGAQIIALCGEFREADCVAMLDADADYLTRPFRAHDLTARVRVAELRRFSASGRPRTYRKGRLAFDLFNRRLEINSRPVALGPSEVAILSLLAGQPGVVAEYKRLLMALGFDGAQSGRRALRSCVFRLRRKIEREPLHPEILLAEAGVGYRLAASSEEAPHRARDSLPSDHERNGYL
jgi:DNA-binding response OmpR family regulator